MRLHLARAARESHTLTPLLATSYSLPTTVPPPAASRSAPSSHPSVHLSAKRPKPARPPLILSLEPVLRCPNRRCGKIAYGISGDLITYSCKSCPAHWWATRLDAGDIRAQIRAAFDGNELFVELLDKLGAPERIETPMFWQLWISGHEQYQFTDKSKLSGILIRSHELIRKLVGLWRDGQ